MNARVTMLLGSIAAIFAGPSATHVVHDHGFAHALACDGGVQFRHIPGVLVAEYVPGVDGVGVRRGPRGAVDHVEIGAAEAGGFHAHEDIVGACPQRWRLGPGEASSCLSPLFSIIGHMEWQLVFRCVWTTTFLGPMAGITRQRLGMAAIVAFLCYAADRLG